MVLDAEQRRDRGIGFEKRRLQMLFKEKKNTEPVIIKKLTFIQNCEAILDQNSKLTTH